MKKLSKETLSKYIVWGLLGLLLAACLLFLLRPQRSGLVAAIQVDNRVVRRIALDEADDGSFSILAETGLPITFEIKDHAIRFAESDCPDKVCVKAGYQKNDLDIASCLPNRTILTVESSK